VEVVSVSTGVGDHRGQSARVHTNGFEGEREGTSFYASASLTLKEADGKRPAGGGFTYRAHRGDLRPLEVVAREAAEEAFGKLGAQKLATGKYTTLVKAEAVGRLLGALLAPLSGGALQQRRSLWEGRLETQIASPLLTLRDDPHVPRGLSSSLWDGDGFATAPRPVIEAGVLKTFLIDDYHAKKMSLERGEPVWATGASLHSLQWDLGPLGFDALVADVRDGVMIDSFLGGNSNATTGELSLGCAGRRIRDGRLAEAVTEVNLSGNLKDLWRQLVAVGADSYPEGASNTPSCVFEGVQLSGV
jgi:PmbA protein